MKERQCLKLRIFPNQRNTGAFLFGRSISLLSIINKDAASPYSEILENQ